MQTRTLRKTFKYRLNPTPEQSHVLASFAGARRWSWNWALAEQKRAYAETGTRLSGTDLCRRLTALKRQPQTAWLREIDSQALQQPIADLERAYSAFFAKRARLPRFKAKKRDRARFRVPQRVRIEGYRVVVPKIGSIPAYVSRPVEGTLKGATFTRDATGVWWVSIVTEREVPVAPPRPLSLTTTIGIDLGLTDALVLSDGTRHPAPRFFRQGETRLRRAQRSLSRCQPGSKRREKTRLRVARVHRRIAHQRADWCHQITTDLTRRYDLICLEDLAVSGLAKTKLGKSVLDVAWGEIGRQLAYKADWQGTEMVQVDRFFPSSQLHHGCPQSHRNYDLTLADRTWTCTCGASVDRDRNAALNIRDEGYRRASDRRRPLGQAGDVKRSRTPIRPVDTQALVATPA